MDTSFLTSFSQLEECYVYYRNGGYMGMLASTVRRFCSYIIIEILGWWILFCIDWDKLTKCDSLECEVTKASRSSFGMFLYVFAAFLYFVCLFRSLIRTFRICNRTKNYLLCLGMQDSRMKQMSWNAVTDELLSAEHVTKSSLTSYITRHQNFILASYAADIFPKCLHGRLFHFLIKYYIVKFSLDYKHNWQTISFVCKIIGALLLLFYPFILFNVFMYEILHNTKNPQNRFLNDLFVRDFSDTSHTLLAKFNELPHLTEKRLNACREECEFFIKVNSSPLLIEFYHMLSFLSGSVLLFCIIVSFCNENALLYVEIRSFNLAWILAFTSTVYGGCKTKIGQSYVENQRKVDENLTTEIVRFYNFKLVNILTEIASCALIPFYFMFKLPDKLESFTSFLHGIAMADPKGNIVCRLHNMDQAYSICSDSDSMDLSTLAELIKLNPSIFYECEANVSFYTDTQVSDPSHEV